MYNKCQGEAGKNLRKVELEAGTIDLKEELAKIDPKDIIRTNLEDVRKKMNGGQ